MGKGSALLSEEKLRAVQNELREKFMENVAVIKEIFPDYEISDEQIEKYISIERIMMHQNAVENIQARNDTLSLVKGYKKPISFERSAYTFCDIGGSADAEEKNKRFLKELNAPTAQGETVRKQAFTDTLNGICGLDESKLRGDLPFTEKAKYALENRKILERGYEFGHINQAKKDSLGFYYSEEHEKNIKRIQDKGVVLGGVGGEICAMIESELFLTFPFEDLNDDQLEQLTFKLQKQLQSKGMAREESAKYTKFVQSIMFTKLREEYTEPSGYKYTDQDAIDSIPSISGLKDDLSGFYGRIDALTTEKGTEGASKVGKMLRDMRNAIRELSNVNGRISEEQAARLKKLTVDLKHSVFDCLPNAAEREGLSENDAARVAQIEKVHALIGESLTDSLLFASMINAHNRKHGKEEDEYFFSRCDAIKQKLDECGITYEEFADNAAALNISEDEYIRFAESGRIKWNPTREELKQTAESFKNILINNRISDIKSKYEINEDNERLLREAQLAPEELEELDFMKKAGSEEEKQAALRGFLDGFGKYDKNNLPENYAKLLKEENLTLDDAKTLAVRQGLSVDEYMNKLFGMEADSERQIDEAVEVANNQLLNDAKNPLERLKAETMIEMKEASFKAGGRGEMERSVAKYIALKSVQSYVGAVNGEDFEKDPNKSEKFGKMVGNLQKYAEDVYNSDTFRYYIKKFKTSELTELTRNGSLEPLENSYKSFFRLMGSKAIHTDFATVADRIRTFSDCAVDREGFLGEKLDSNGDLIPPKNNPFHLTVGRQALVALAMGKMLERGFELEDILDPFKLSQVKQEFGREAYEQVQENTPENRQAIVKSYLTLLDKSVALANRQVSKLDSLTPSEVAKMKEMTFFATEAVIKDSLQELGTLRSAGAFTPEDEARYASLSEHADAIDKVYDAVDHSFRTIKEIGSKGSHPNPEDTIRRSLRAPYLNEAFRKTKENARKNNITVSEQMRRDHAEKPGDLSTFLGACAASPLCLMDFSLPREVNSKMYENDTLMKGLARDIFDGTFSNQIFALKKPNGSVEYNMKYIEKLADLASAKKKVTNISAPEDNLSLWF